MKNITPILSSLGLLDSEINTYLAALKHGPGTVLELIKLTRLSRQATYTAIEALTERGLMTSVTRGKKRYYAAEHPDKLLAYAQRRESELKERIGDLKRTLPELELVVGGERPLVKVYEGKEGVRAILDDVRTSSPKELKEITDLDAMYNILTPEDLKPFRDALKKAKTNVKGIYSGEPTDPASKLRNYYLPEGITDFKADIGVYGNKVALITFEGKMYSVIVESKALAKTLSILFDLAWECLKKQSKK